MDLLSRKIAFVREFIRIQNEEVVLDLEKLLQKHKAELHERNLKPLEFEQFINEIEQALEDSENERIIEASVLKSKIMKWG